MAKSTRKAGTEQVLHLKDGESVVVPVMKEEVILTKEIAVTEEIFIRKSVHEEVVRINLPLKQDRYQITRTKVDLTFDEYPPVRNEGNCLVIPVVEEVLVIVKKYRVTEEIRALNYRNDLPFLQELSLKKETVEIQRKPIS